MPLGEQEQKPPTGVAICYHKLAVKIQKEESVPFPLIVPQASWPRKWILKWGDAERVWKCVCTIYEI